MTIYNILLTIIIQMMQTPIQKRTHIHNVLKIQDESDSDSDYDGNQIQNALCSLLPIYIQYRQHLKHILDQTPNPIKKQLQKQLGAQKLKVLTQKNISSQKYRLQQYLSDQKMNNSNIQSTKNIRMRRMILTDQIINKRQRKVSQQKMLQAKYNQAQLKQIFSPKEDQILQNFQPNYTIHLSQPHRSNSLSQSKHKSIKKQQDPFKKGIANYNRQKIANNKQMIVPRQRSQKNSQRSSGSKYRIKVSSQAENIQQNIFQPQNNQHIQKNIQNYEKIGYQIPQLSRQESHQLQQDFEDSFNNRSQLEINHNLIIRNNLARKNQDQTHSQVNYVNNRGRSHHIQAFDTLTQRPRRSNSKILIQKQKINQQRKKAQLLKKRVTEALQGKTNDMQDQQFKPSKIKTKTQETLKRRQYSAKFVTENSLKHNMLSDQQEQAIDDEDRRISFAKLNRPFVDLKEMKQSMASRKSLASHTCTQNQMQSHYLKTLKYLFGELCQLAAMAQIYKFLLRNKQYQILLKLSQNPNEAIISQKNLRNGISRLLQAQQKDTNKNKCTQILLRIFKNSKQISYDEFSSVFSPKIYENQYGYLSAKISKQKTHKTLQYVHKLFSVWLQMHYFQTNIQQTISHNVGYADTLASILQDPNNAGHIDIGRAQQFIFEHRNCRVNHKKVQLYFQQKYPSLSLNLLVNSNKTRKSKYR